MGVLYYADQAIAIDDRTLAHLKVAAVTRNDVSKLHRNLSDTPRQANFALTVCSKAFSLAELWGMRVDGTNPCKSIERNSEAHP